ncbi:MAG TPA: class I adenylate-forming enzyme family protein [Myxococcota bacterium]|nr:class I adenylate-forming enzyme family protein [Myxococcota bacterium]
MMARTVLDWIRAHAARDPDHPALIVAESGAAPRRVGYGELVARVDALAARLRAAGVERAQRCGLVARQGPGFIELALAILATDACLVPIADDHAGAVLDEFAERAYLHWIALERPGERGFELVARANVPAVDGNGERDFAALAPAYLRFTSGTTSRRKGVILGHAAVLARLDAANRGLGIAPRDRILWLLPMAHHFVVSILLYLRHGATILLPPGSLARAMLELAAGERATVLYASPYHMALLAKDASGVPLPDLRLVISTAEGLRAETARAFQARFGCPISQALGIIEVGLPVLNLGASAKKPDALGRPLPDYDVWLRGDDGQPVAPPTSAERTGEICIRGPGLFDAYLDPWTPARAVLEPDGFRTGDQGYFDADGDLYLVGRRTNRINMAGMKFFSEEVEAVLDAHPGVLRSRVLPRAHAHLGEIPVAEIQPADAAHPPSRAELVAHCRARLPAYKIPREFRVVESLPHTATGKLARRPTGPTAARRR